ncbi:NAD-dependent epimerase/dehydratase family protein [Roseimaritima sediminicola]|uniref:NAD-dependent epimerase/dehydratase family protein n=1 Tax=Roseimaritima sediminicola TaxID=2662066 RepID=UPI0012982545|nr:NAD(P)-dependent oxidoreductase [Roseimaritima sediminicola]
MDKPRPTAMVTGSSGLLGQQVCTALAEAGFEVFALDRVGPPEPPKAHPQVHDIECDLADYANVHLAIDDVRKRVDAHLDTVVHLAAYYDFSGEDSPLYETVTINGTDRLLNALDDFQVDQFIFSSTMLIHKPCEVGQHIREEDPLEAKWPYPESKIETERLIRDGHPDVRSVFLRISGVYTDWGKQPTLVQQIKRIYEKDFQSHFFPGDRTAGQSPVYLDDVVDAIVRTVQRRSEIEPKTAILIGEPDPPSYGTLQDKIGELIHGRQWATMYVPPTVAKVGAAVTDKVSGGEAFIKPFMVAMADDHYALDISRATQLLGWKPQHNLLDHLPGIVQRLLDDPDQWYRKNGLEK